MFAVVTRQPCDPAGKCGSLVRTVSVRSRNPAVVPHAYLLWVAVCHCSETHLKVTLFHKAAGYKGEHKRLAQMGFPVCAIHYFGSCGFLT